MATDGQTDKQTNKKHTIFLNIWRLVHIKRKEIGNLKYCFWRDSVKSKQKVEEGILTVIFNVYFGWNFEVKTNSLIMFSEDFCFKKVFKCHIHMDILEQKVEKKNVSKVGGYVLDMEDYLYFCYILL